MTQYASEFLNVLQARGFIHQGTNLEGLDARAAKGPIAAYIGFDATAPSLHAGSLIQIMMLYWLQQTGHKPIVLMGGGTTKVGDPTGKDSQRKLLSDAEIDDNIAGIKRAFDPFLDFNESANGAVMVNNDDWLSRLGYVEFLRDYGVHFTINRMLTFDSVKLRLERESPMTFLEFNYMLMQAYDYLELHRRFDCALQMGGSDQWGNIVNGVELCRRVAAASGDEQADVFGLTTPLLTTASGKKMGKSERGAVWLNSDMFSAYDYWQYWRNCEDADVPVLLRRFTILPMDEIARLEKLEGAELNEAKKILATEATAMLHGRDAAVKAAETARQTFEQGGAAGDLPSIMLPKAALEKGIAVLIPFRDVGLIASNGEGMRHIKAGALKINDQPVERDKILNLDDLKDGVIKLSVGKKKHALVKIDQD